MEKMHSFHIPVMGIGFTIDTPLKVSHFGIDSVISLVDDILLEKMRKMYCGKYDIPYNEITDKADDFRAKRITAYLDLINDLADKKFEEFKNTASEIKKYFSLLPDGSKVKEEFNRLAPENTGSMGEWLDKYLSRGSIDVNIMTKVDKDNYRDNEKLPVEYNDAHAALRGFAKSKLSSALVLSAGMSPRLYSYLENFEDFYPDGNGYLKKKIILKVSDYRSALIQGKFLANKGLWVSEYRVESGLNCGGHAFATDGYLLGPILAEFKEKRGELTQTIHSMLQKGLSAKKRVVPETILPLKITAQGGVGTAEEHQFLLNHYQLDSIGWGTPFLLVPEVTTVDDITLNKLIEAKEEDLYLSNISPLGVPFNSLRGNTKDIEKLALVAKGRPGSSCPKEFVSFNNEFTEKKICTASRQYQFLKIKELDNKSYDEQTHREHFNKIIDKSCICVGLGNSALIVNDIDTKTEGTGVSICPGPNLAYFSKKMSLEEIVDHIYGRTNVIERTDRPHVFMKELTIYIDYLKNKIADAKADFTDKQAKQLLVFSSNLKDGINYYFSLFNNFIEKKETILDDLEKSKLRLEELVQEIEALHLSSGELLEYKKPA